MPSLRVFIMSEGRMVEEIDGQISASAVMQIPSRTGMVKRELSMNLHSNSYM